MKTIGDAQFCDDFLQGQRDCQAGIPHKPGKGDSYDRGYATQYERDQQLTHNSLLRGGEIK